jgi:AAA family ATPase
MSSITSRVFTVESDGAVEYAPRAARRLIFHADVLKSTKLCAGDIVAISSGSTPLKVGVAHGSVANVHFSVGLFSWDCMAFQ